MIVKKESRVHFRSVFLILVVTAISACTARASYIPDTKWRVSVAMPSFYPVNVTEAYGVNESSDWTSPIHNFTQFFSTSELNAIQEWLPSYDGFGLPLNNFTMMRNRQVSPVKELPDEIYLYWVSLINTKFYATKYALTDDIKKLSSTKVSYLRGDGFVVDECYRTEFVFGLKPNGNAEVFLKGCGDLIHIQELAPEIVMDKDIQGFGVEDYKKRSYLGIIQKRADKADATLNPIPWDKVNKIYTKDEISELN